MANKKTEYNVINVFSDGSETQRKSRVNEIIKNLCVNELEFVTGLDYNEGTTLLGDALSLKKGASNNVN